MAGGLNSLVPELRDAAVALVDAATEAGLSPRVTSTLRSRSEQSRLYRRYLAGQSAYPVAAPGTSAHEYGWAFDMVTSPLDALADVGYTWETWGGSWNARDAVHFELPGASGEARRLGAKEYAYQEPLRIPVVIQAADFLISLFPYIGWVTLVATLVSWFPQYSKSEIVQTLANPATAAYRAGFRSGSP